jgi:Protein of unknown function (DUF998)
MADDGANAVLPAMRDKVRSRPGIALAGVIAALLSNYWVLEGALDRRTDLSASWISDLAARSEAFGWRFEALAIISGLAVAGFALLLLAPLGERSPMIRRGLLALLATGALGIAAGIATPTCAEALEASCSLGFDALDVLHSAASLAEIVITVLAFAWVGLGLTRLAPDRSYGRVTLALGALWLMLTVLTGLGYSSNDLDSVKGLFQRGDQVLFGAWLVLLGIWAQGSADTVESA